MSFLTRLRLAVFVGLVLSFSEMVLSQTYNQYNRYPQQNSSPYRNPYYQSGYQQPGSQVYQVQPNYPGIQQYGYTPDGYYRKQKPTNNNQNQIISVLVGNDAQLVAAVNARKSVNYAEGSNMQVVKLLPDDTVGLKHQKWIVRLSSGQLMQAVYNLDLCERVPLKVGDVVSMGGQFVWTNQGGLLHWLHFDPRKLRKDGYVGLNGKLYCLH